MPRAVEVGVSGQGEDCGMPGSGRKPATRAARKGQTVERREPAARARIRAPSGDFTRHRVREESRPRVHCRKTTRPVVSTCHRQRGRSPSEQF